MSLNSSAGCWLQGKAIFCNSYDFSFNLYRAFHEFRQAKFAYGGSILGSSQFSQLPQLPLKMTIDLKVVKLKSKLIISLC